MSKRSALTRIRTDGQEARREVEALAARVPGHGLLAQFRAFLNEYKVLPLAIAFIIGVAATALVQALVNDLVMPAITPFVPGGAWETATLALGPVVLKWGAFAGALINFIIIAFVVFLIAKFVFREDVVAKK